MMATAVNSKLQWIATVPHKGKSDDQQQAANSFFSLLNSDFKRDKTVQLQGSRKTSQKWWLWCTSPRSRLPSPTISKQPSAFQNKSHSTSSSCHWAVNCGTRVTSDSEMDSKRELKTSCCTSWVFAWVCVCVCVFMCRVKAVEAMP